MNHYKIVLIVSVVATVFISVLAVQSVSAETQVCSFELGKPTIYPLRLPSSSYDPVPQQVSQVPGEPELNVNKTVLDPETGAWVEEITAKVGDPVTFHISGVFTNVSSFCSSNITLDIYDFAEDFQGEGVLFLVLENDTVTMYGNVSATIIGCGSGLNLFGISFICDDTGQVLTAEDTASVNIICPTPAYTATGLITLVGLLSAIAALRLKIRKRR